MLTHYQAKRQASPANKAIRLNVRPELRIKMKFHRPFQQQNATQPHQNQLSRQPVISYMGRTINKLTELSQLQEGSCELGLKRKIGRRLSSYQMYKEEQKHMKTGHYNKIKEWKNKFLLKGKPTIKRDSLRFLRTKSISYYSGKNSRASMLGSIHPNQSLQSEGDDAFRSRVMTCEGQVKQPTNINKIKIKLELNLLTSSISRQSSQYQSLKPKISTISPSTKSNNIIKYNLLQAKQRQRMSNISQRGKDKVLTMRPFETKDCRPWSGVKGEAYVPGDIFIF